GEGRAGGGRAGARPRGSGRGPRVATGSREPRRDLARPRQLLGGVDVHEDDRGIAIARDLALGDLDHADFVEEADDLEPPGDEPRLDRPEAALPVRDRKSVV